MEWNEIHRYRLYHILEDKWKELEDRLGELGIHWVELDEVHDAPTGTVAVWEGPGFKDENKKMCWVIPDEVALKLLVLFP